jgi:hypothetical protein
MTHVRKIDRARTGGAGPRQIRLPGFVVDEPVGLGEVIKRATSVAGIKPCGGCAQRAQRLDGRIVFTGRDM